jgi:hypothetical protein
MKRKHFIIVISALSLGIYVLSFFFDSFMDNVEWHYPGWYCATFGAIGSILAFLELALYQETIHSWQLIWLANPLYIYALTSFYRGKKPIKSVLAAFLFSLLFIECHGSLMLGIGPDFERFVAEKMHGYYLWHLSMLILCIGLLFLYMLDYLHYFSEE